MFGGVNPRQMQGMMRKMGISQEDIKAEKVIIEKKDGEKIVITNPSITRIKMQGQISYQIGGEENIETSTVETSKDDIKTIMEKTGCSEEIAKKTLEETGDLADAIMELS